MTPARSTRELRRAGTKPKTSELAHEMTSAKVAHRLNGLGYAKVRVLKGGLASWANAGLPLEGKS